MRSLVFDWLKISSHTHMNGFDVVLLLPLCWGVYSGFKKGFLVELLSSLLLIFGFIKGVTWFNDLRPVVACKFPMLGNALPFMLGGAMFILGGGTLYLTMKLLKGLLNITFLGIIDNILGALFGLYKAAFIISLFLSIWRYSGLFFLSPSYMDESSLLPFLEPIVPKVLHSISSWGFEPSDSHT